MNLKNHTPFMLVDQDSGQSTVIRCIFCRLELPHVPGDEMPSKCSRCGGVVRRLADHRLTAKFLLAGPPIAIGVLVSLALIVTKTMEAGIGSVPLWVMLLWVVSLPSAGWWGTTFCFRLGYWRRSRR